jgi:hypothetical protein
MTCRHTGNDPNCSNYRGPYGDIDPYEKSWKRATENYEREMQSAVERYKSSSNVSSKTEVKPVTPVTPVTPDSMKYEILEIEEMSKFLVMKVKYPNCSQCSFEGTKVLVLEATLAQAIFWNEIDPHFRDEKPTKKKAPSPIARFPATGEGWKNAIAFTRTLLS